jgi:alkyl hydroperoxide reductase subunit AhpF
MLDADLKDQLKTYLERATRPITIAASVDDSEASIEMMGLLADLVSVSDKITVTEHRGGAERTPSFALTSPGRTSACASPVCRWAMSSPRWCWRCCRSAATRRSWPPP